jgi:PAS domain S-box-containing protein
MKKTKVLLIEDNKFDQMAFIRFMKDDDRYDYTIADSIEKAKALLNTEKFDVLISDHQLGDGTAFDVINMKLNAPIIVTTGHGNEEIAVKVMKLGAKDYLIKDMEANYLKVLPFIIENAIKHNKDEESLLRFAGIVESMDDAIIYCSLDGNILSWNPGAEKMFGYLSAEISDKHIALLFPSANNSHAGDLVEKVKKGGHISHFETLFLKKDSTEIDVSYSASPIKDVNDNIIGISIIATNITERKKNQSIIFEKEELYRSVVESLSEGLIITNNDGKILFVNSKMEELTDFSKEEMIDKVVHELLFPTRLVEQDKDATSGEIKISKKLDIKINKKDGNTFLGHVNVTPYCNSKGEILGIVGTVTDITISNREEELESLLIAATKSFNAVKISERDGRIEWVNEGFTKLSGYTQEDVKGTHGELLMREDAGLSEQKRVYEIIQKEKKPISFENKNYSKEGLEYWVITTLTPVLDEDGEVDRVIAIDSDITLRKQIEEKLIVANKIAEHSIIKGNKALYEIRKAKKQVEASAKAKEQFLANMSHEIRTPMNGIIGLTRVLLNTHLTADQREYLNAIKTSGDTLLVVINDILDLSKMEAGRMTFEEIPFNISSITNSITDLFYPKAKDKDKDVEIKKHIDEKIPQPLLGDPSRLNQILMNLMSNAIKFTQKGEVILSVQLKEENEQSVTVQFSVSDTGTGIPKDKISSLFLDFTQASAEIARKFGGTGLGLAITKRLVELQSGQITVESKVDVGSTFSFFLSFKKCKDMKKEAEILSREDSEEMTPMELVRARILLVEDNPVNQLLAEKILGDWECIVDTADNGKIALDKLRENEYDLVLMDIKMPEMDGYEATEHIRKMEAPLCNIPILAATAHAATWEAEKCIQAGMNAYISKPFDVKELSDKLVKLLREKTNKNKEKSVPMMGETSSEESQNSNKFSDLTYLKSISRGSDAFVIKMINSILIQLTEDIFKMKEMAERKDLETLGFIAHRAKPSFHFIGVKPGQEALTNVEQYAKQKINLEQIPGILVGVEDHFEKARIELMEDLKQLELKVENNKK